jgi:chemotaxis protein methyltransferase CheR
MTHFGFRNLHISATDVDETGKFGPTLLEGSYPANELERVPVSIREKYFTCEADGQLRVTHPVRDRVTFRKHDLLSLEPVGDGFSLVVCKNVLLHFTPEQRVQVIRMFYDALEPDGCLAMEQTQKLPPGTEHLFVQVAPGTQLFAKLKTGVEPVQVTQSCLER